MGNPSLKLHILSDMHLEFSTFEPPATDADVVVLAGDIGKETNGINWARSAFPDKNILYVPGNHEFYGADRPETLAAIRAAAQECGVHLLDEDEVVINGVRFLGCTLWTDFRLFGEAEKPFAMLAGQQGLNDFRVIQEGSSGCFSPSKSVELHEKSLAWLKTKLDEPFDGKTVAVTHHLPSMRSVVDRFKGSQLSACFASELDYLFGKMALWIHGHTHDNLDYEANGTRVICNPRGYVTYNCQENFDFKPGLVIEI
ncbi:MAG: metallophosphoesterase [Gallionella sp.]|nr:metallophosphoesterase [Gallionella sp.]